MSITYDGQDRIFCLETAHTIYSFQIAYGEFPVHLYYGSKGGHYEKYEKTELYSFAPFYDRYGLDYLPDVCLSEYSGYDSGDFRTSSLQVRNVDGNAVTVLVYKGNRIFDGRCELEGLPYAEAAEDTQTLELQMEDRYTGLLVYLYYTVYEKEDVISRYVRLENQGQNSLVIEKCMSLLLDLPHHDFDMISLPGRYNFERQYQRTPLTHGYHSVFSRRGASSHHYNPFIALCSPNATESRGEVYGFNFVYSGNFLDEIEVSYTESTRVQIGIGSDHFRWNLNAGEEFCSPEAIMTYTDAGIGQLSRNFHAFINRYILPEETYAQRPVVVNTWEARYFDFDEEIVLQLAKQAADIGIDTLVVDDGWFGDRENDKTSLGDWYVNTRKFPNGLEGCVQKIKDLGLNFGIWIEPEAVSVESGLYKAHPDWCIQCKGREPMMGRNTLLLDMGNPEVIRYLQESFLRTFKNVEVDYFKWDMNRHMSQAGSLGLPAKQQEEAAHRYILGVYKLLRWFRETYPNAMIETCSGGGGRYDLGMMKYGTMIWTSDNTNPKSRTRIQYSSMLAYPASTMSCHVTNYRRCEDDKELKYRYEVALGGALGYELDLLQASERLKKNIACQIKEYRQYEKLILKGDYYSLSNPYVENYNAYYYADEKRQNILLTYVQNAGEEGREIHLPISAADAKASYRERKSGMIYRGDELQKGVSVMTSAEEDYSNMWYFEKI